MTNSTAVDDELCSFSCVLTEIMAVSPAAGMPVVFRSAPEMGGKWTSPMVCTRQAAMDGEERQGSSGAIPLTVKQVTRWGDSGVAQEGGFFASPWGAAFSVSSLPVCTLSSPHF